MVRMMESGYKRRRWPICDFCKSRDLNFQDVKGYVRCDNCGKLFAKKHKFEKVIE